MLKESEKRGTTGLLGSIDCCKWTWKNCPTAWHGQFKGKEKTPTVTLEAICDRSLWIWHAFRQKLFASVQEAIRKDIERAFGVLQGKFNIISRPSKFLSVEGMEDVMRCVIILDNMCVEEREVFGMEMDEEEPRDVVVGGGVPAMWCGLARVNNARNVEAVAGSVAALCQARELMADEAEHARTKKLLMDHLWEKQGEEYSETE